MLDKITQENKLFQIILMKDMDYLIKIVSIWITLDELEGGLTRRDFADRSVTKQTKIFTHGHKFGLHFKYRHKLCDNNKWINVPIYLERTLETNLWLYHNFYWYIAVSEVNIYLASGKFQNCGAVQPSLYI